MFIHNLARAKWDACERPRYVNSRARSVYTRVNALDRMLNAKPWK